MDVRPRIKSVEGRSRVAVAHLAVARSQNTRTGILGYIRKTAMMAVFFVVGSVCDEIIREDARKVLFMWKKYWKIGLIFVCLSFIGVMGMIEPYIPDDREITVTNTYEEYGQEYFETAFVEESSEEEEVPFVLTRNPHIRVVLKTSDYGGIFHRNVLLSCSEEYDLLNKEGVLYKKDSNDKEIELIQYPTANTRTTYSIPNTVTIIDEYSAPFVRRAFQIYSAGNISLEKTCQKLLDEGFCYKNSQPRIYRSQLEHILKNPFYYGMVCFKDEIYQGVHKPLISKDLFDEVQKAFKKDNKPKHLIARDFLFGGVLRCANCGCIVSGEIKKGKYIYYSCTGAKRPCEQKHKYIRESVIERQIVEAIERIKIDEKQKSWIQTVLAESFKDEQKYTKTMLNSLNKQKEILSKRIETIYLDKLDGKITEEFWLQKHEEWSASLSKIQNKIESLFFSFISKIIIYYFSSSISRNFFIKTFFLHCWPRY